MKYRLKYLDPFIGIACIQRKRFGFLWLRDWSFPAAMDWHVEETLKRLNK